MSTSCTSGSPGPRDPGLTNANPAHAQSMCTRLFFLPPRWWESKKRTGDETIQRFKRSLHTMPVMSKRIAVPNLF